LESSVQTFSGKTWSELDVRCMTRALELAALAEAQGEVPVGAVVVCGGEVCGEGWNRPIAARDLRFGAVRSKFRLADSELLNHRVVVEEGLLGVAAAELLARFFLGRRG
jgi:tRNA(Arg) A34 adenosine deaminase TadA